MSAAANWSYTAKATHWPRLGRDDWTGQESFGAPVHFDCDYSAESVRMTDANGVEFTSRQTLYTEYADVKQGDFVLVGESNEASPIAAGAVVVRTVVRDADTFDRIADDYRILT